MAKFKPADTIRLISLLIISCSPVLAQDARLIAKNIFPSVVMLEMRDEKDRPISIGSGFFVRPDVVVTNYHVIDGASDGFAKIVGETSVYHIEGVVGIDKGKDLALLKLVGLRRKPLTLADISKIEVGEEVFALGNPKGLEGTISPGIISGSSLRVVHNENLIQITAPISPGSSGGPVVNRKGEVIGVAVASIIGGQNLNFAVPSSYLAVLLANVAQITSLSSISLSQTEKPPQDKQPSLADTTNWLTLKLEGAQHTERRPGFPNDPILITIKTLQFSGCELSMELLHQTGERSSIYSYKTGASLSSIEEVRSGIDGLGMPINISLILKQKVLHSVILPDGKRRISEVNRIRIPVPDLQLSERVTRAFEMAAKLCKQRVEREPF